VDAEQISELVQRAAGGEQSAWDAIVEEYARVVWATVRRYRLQEAQAADAVQTTWLRLVEHLGEIRDPARLPGWLRTTAARACLEIARDAGRFSFTGFAQDECGHPGNASLDPDRVEDLPERSAVREDHIRILRATIETLSPADRQLVDVLLSPVPLSYAEISARLNMPVGSIGPTRGRVLNRMREALEKAGITDAALD
jgi:RNA polymerase sigma factor (sigma-70 family)